MIFTKYCRTPVPVRLSFGCYFSYDSEKILRGMLRTCKGQFIHRLGTEERWKNVLDHKDAPRKRAG